MRVSLLLVSVMFVVSCGPKTHELKGGRAPAWANRAPGGWKCDLDGKSGFCSMGMVSGVRHDAAMRRTAAAERARAGLQRLFDTYSASLFRSYQAATTEFRDASEEQHVEQALKTFSAGHLSGVEMRDYWENDSGDAFALAFLSLDDFKAALDKMGELSAKAREVIKANADKMFQELREEEAKQEVK